MGHQAAGDEAPDIIFLPRRLCWITNISLPLPPHSPVVCAIFRICVRYRGRVIRASNGETFRAVSHNETERERQIGGIGNDTAEAKLRNSRNGTMQTSTLIHGAANYIASYTFLLFPPIERIPICPKAYRDPPRCQRVAEPIRRALVFGSLWQHHGLHDYFFMQTRDRRGIVRE